MPTDALQPKTDPAHAAASSGPVRLQGGASMSLCAILLGGLASGRTRITGLVETQDVTRAAAAMAAMGARIGREGKHWIIDGTGNGCLLEPTAPLDFGSAPAACRLVMGLAGAYDMDTAFHGDEALSRLPLGDVLDPLRAMGVQVAGNGDHLPIRLRGSRATAPITWRAPPGAADDVAAAVLLAGLNTAGLTTVIEPETAPEHMPTLLRAFGATVFVEADADGFRHTRIEGQGNLAGRAIVLEGGA